MSLKAFIQQENKMHALFNAKLGGNPMYPEDTDLLLDRHKEELAQRIASALSPEALTCDGELRGAPLRARARLLNTAKAELEALGVTVPAY